MVNVFDCIKSALIEAKHRTKAQDDVDKAIDNLVQSVKTDGSVCCAIETLNNKIGYLMNEEFELGIMCGFQLAVQLIQPVNLG